jgi:hypothetical protein
VRTGLAVGLLAAAACGRGHHEESAPLPVAPPPAQGPTTPAAGCELPALPLRRPAPRRLVAIGDLHGDLGGARAALGAAGAIDDGDHWRGGDLVVVQTGDVLDRGDDERTILELLWRLGAEARAAGGDVIPLLGNHELMNAAGDFRYVTPGGFRDFAAVPGVDVARYGDVPAEARGRVAALAPGGVYARKLAAEAAVVIVGDTAFSHAGVVGAWATDLEAVNRDARCWLDGHGGQAPPAALTATDSPLWTRALAGKDVDCAAVDRTLATLGVARMVFGHTVQDHGVSSACDGKVWRIDVGLAKLYGGPIEVLELVPGAAPQVVRGTR